MNFENVRLFYLATPYTKYRGGIWPAYKEAARIAGQLLQAGLNVYSPIAHSHPLAIYGDLDPRDHKFWMRVDEPFCALCDGLLIATMEGWRESAGVEIERLTFQHAGKPIYYVDPATLAITEHADEAVA